MWEEIRVYFKVPVRCLACIYKVVRFCGILFWFLCNDKWISRCKYRCE